MDFRVHWFVVALQWVLARYQYALANSSGVWKIPLRLWPLKLRFSSVLWYSFMLTFWFPSVGCDYTRAEVAWAWSLAGHRCVCSTRPVMVSRCPWVMLPHGHLPAPGAWPGAKEAGAGSGPHLQRCTWRSESSTRSSAVFWGNFLLPFRKRILLYAVLRYWSVFKAYFFSRTQLRAFNGGLLYEGTTFIFSVDMLEDFSFLLYFCFRFLLFLEQWMYLDPNVLNFAKFCRLFFSLSCLNTSWIKLASSLMPRVTLY